MKNLWSYIYLTLLALSAAYMAYCVLHHDGRLPMAVLCLLASAYLYAKEREKK